MTAFQEGQNVEVKMKVAAGCAYDAPMSTATWLCWRNAKIVSVQRPATWTGDTLYEVEFPGGTRAVFDAEDIRTIDVMCLNK